MNTLQVRGRWHSVRGLIREGWGRRTGNQMEVADAPVEKVRGRLQRQSASRLPRSFARERVRLEQRQRNGSSPWKEPYHD